MRLFLIRTGTGILLVTLVLASIFVSGEWGNVVNIFNVFLLFACLSMFEYRMLLEKLGNNLSIYFFVVAMVVYFLVSHTSFWNTAELSTVILVLISSFILFFAVELFRKEEKPFQNIAYSLMGIAWIIIPFSLINLFPTLTPNSNQGKFLLLALFVFVWLYDTMAYCIGSLLGRHQLMKHVSPKKSWEGTIGSAILTVGLAFLAPKLFTMITLSTLQWVGFAVIVVVMGTLGDLVESLFKRQVDVKDSGTILPGHGGILDRFDSILLIVPVILLYLHFLYKVV
ncbi:MAG: phosphatidate cytidylyltransferase [Bacteroidales bacterium]|jgi:phosphatidate cytidylyltransferase|nr:phosphatidate cytidylyltransferase [Bacteroidales bacterium]